MATIRARRNADGTVMYTAQIRIKRGGAQVYQESASFSRKRPLKHGRSVGRLNWPSPVA